MNSKRTIPIRYALGIVSLGKIWALRYKFRPKETKNRHFWRFIWKTQARLRFGYGEASNTATSNMGGMVIDCACAFDHLAIVTLKLTKRQLPVGFGVGVGAGDKMVMILTARMILGFFGSGM